MDGGTCYDECHAADDRNGDERAGGEIPNHGFRFVIHWEHLPLATSRNLNRGRQGLFRRRKLNALAQQNPEGDLQGEPGGQNGPRVAHGTDNARGRRRVPFFGTEGSRSLYNYRQYKHYVDS